MDAGAAPRERAAAASVHVDVSDQKELVCPREVQRKAAPVHPFAIDPAKRAVQELVGATGPGWQWTAALPRGARFPHQRQRAWLLAARRSRSLTWHTTGNGAASHRISRTSGSSPSQTIATLRLPPPTDAIGMLVASRSSFISMFT